MQHSTNYVNSFITVAEDCPANNGTVPPIKDRIKSIAQLQFDLLYNNPYKYTSDELLLTVQVTRKEIGKNEVEDARNELFSKGQACLRASPLATLYGWGIHHNEESKVAVISVGIQEYELKIGDQQLTKIPAMRSKKQSRLS